MKIKALIFSSITALTLAAQSVTGFAAEKTGINVDPTGRSEGFSAVLYDNTNGLPTSEANDIEETGEGFIWIGSYSGLVRYDGNTFERMDSTNGIASVVSLYVDNSDRLWIGTNDNGIAVMENGEYRMYGKADGLKSASIRDIEGDSAGNIYVATAHGLALIDSELNMHIIDEPQIMDQYIRSLVAGEGDSIYGLTQTGDIFIMENGRLAGFFSSSKLGVDNVVSIFPNASNPGYIYLGTVGSEIYYGRLDNGMIGARKIDISPLSFVNTMKIIDDQLWVCTDSGIGMFDEDGFEKLENIPADNSIEKMMTDYEGNLWFTSSRQGVMKIVPNQFSDIFERYNVPSAVVNSTSMYDNKLFCGTDSGLIVIGESGVTTAPILRAVTASGENVDATELSELLTDCRIRSITKDSKGRLWFSTYGKNGLVRYDAGKVTLFTTDDGMPSDRVRVCYECMDGTMIVACSGGGVVQIKNDKVQVLYDTTSGIGSADILTICEMENGDLVFGSDGDGIYVVSGTRIIHVSTDDGLNSGVVMRVKKDIIRDLTWVVTSNSIAYMDSDYNVTTVKGFPYSNNFDLYENKSGDMWILSSGGVYVIPVEDMIKNEEVSPIFYGMANGLPCIATANSYSCLMDDGELYIAGSTGVARVNIDKPFDDVNEVKMAVPYLEADGNFIYPSEDGSFIIPSNIQKITIYAYVYTYSLMDPVVTYYLDGFDQEHNSVDRSDLVPIDYTNLRGGTYHFVMQLSDSKGRGNNELSVDIVKELTIFENLLFKVGLAFLAIVIIAALVQLYIEMKTRSLLKKEEENKTFIREMIEAFAKTIDMKDKYTNGHSTRVAEYTVMLARELGYDEDTVEKYHNIALLHDIGKIGVPPEVLNKPGQLTDDEFKIIKSHSALGYNVLKDISVMPELAVGAGAHHERPDGKGYPKGLTSEDIPRVAQIIGVADTFDAMYSDRPYRKRMNFDKAVSIIKEVSGTQLEPDVVDAFLRLVEKGEFRAPDDEGGGTVEDIDNIRKNYKKEEEQQNAGKDDTV